MPYQNTVFFQLQANNVYNSKLEFEDTQGIEFRGQVYVDLIKRLNASIRWDIYNDPTVSVKLRYCSMTEAKLICLREWKWNHQTKSWEMVDD